MRENKTTLCYLEQDGKLLMLFRNKKENDPCEGKWVGIGGKFEEGETSDECLLREVFEETGLSLTSYSFCGIVHFISDTVDNEDMYLYTADRWMGTLTSCTEGELKWIAREDVLSLNLWEGDRYFLEPLLKGKKDIEITCRYEGDHLAEYIDHSKTE